ncbi:MAG: ABC transporter ATP-binding protein [Anaerolineae bacterium]|nr:ABC transporter ATP-binding protein [Anaerolineae bacterium]
MIVAQGLTKYFDTFLAVDHVDLQVPQGEVLVLLGKNGAGKTTTVRMLTSILRPSNGWAKVAGYDVVEQADQVRASVGVLTEHHGLYGRMTSEEYLQFFGSLYRLPRSESARRAKPLLELFGLDEARKKRLGEYSKGMRQKLALVRALMHDPPVLLLDEPTSAMDPESARTVRDAIARLRGQGRTILLCTHNLAEGEELADRVAIIQAGRILIHGAVEDVKRKLLGPVIYEARFAQAVTQAPAGLPAGVSFIEARGDALIFQVENPTEQNPDLLQSLMSQGLRVIAFQEVSRSLEQAFLEAVRNHGEVQNA